VRDGQGGAWIGTRRGVVRMRPIGDGVLRAVDERGQLPQHEVNAMLVDREGNIWLATNVGLVRVPRARPFHVIATEPGEVVSLAPGNDGALVVLDPDTVVRLRDGRSEPISRGLARNGMLGIVSDGGFEWIGSWQDGLFRVDGKMLRRVPLDGWEAGDTIRPLLSSRQGRGLVLAVGTGKLVSWSPAHAEWTSFTDLGVKSELVAGAEDESSGRLWLASERQGLVVVGQDGSARRMGRAQGIPSENLTALVEGRRGALWIGTRDRGLVHLRDDRFTAIGRAQGLGTDAVVGLLRDERGGHLWITTASEGMIRASEDELEAVVAGRSAGVATRPFTTRDGLPTSGSADRSAPAGFVDRLGRVWLGSFRGVVVFDDPSVAAPVLPVPRLESVRVDGQEIASGARVHGGRGELQVRYTAALFEGRERLRFRHRLAGFETGWRDVGDAHEAWYASLPAGNYRFHLVPYFSGAPGSPAGPETVFAFALVPPFYRTGSFFAAAGVALVLAALLVGRLRLQSRRRQQAVLAHERNRIAREIHDSLEQTLYAAKMQLEAGAPSGNRPSHLTRGIELVERAIDEARAAVWALRTGVFGRADLSVAISVTAGDSLRHSDVAFSLDTEGVPYKLPAVTEWHVGQTVREAFTNALKHGKPTRLSVRLVYGPSLVVSVIDDGVGTAAPVEGDSSGHYGLQGMRERLRACGGRVTLDSEPGRGTVVRIEIPRDASAMDR
jgi:signal transduction histidine kinase